MCVAALLGITAGTLYQKKHCARMDLRTGTLIQYLVTLAVMASLSLALETGDVSWHGEFVFALVWLIRQGAAAKVASLFYLVPPVTSLVAFAMFGETYSAGSLIGFGLAAVGVALVHRG